MSDLVEVQDLRKSYSLGTEIIEVLKGATFTLGEGDFVAVVGPSGVGKSTLLHLLGALDTPTGGEIRYRGTSFAHFTEQERAAFRNRTVGFVFQFHHLLPEFTALENVMMPLLIARRPVRESREAAEAVLVEMGLGERLHHRPAELSGGEQQRVAIGRAVVGRPEILLADEPTGNLDSKTGEGVFEVLSRLNREGNVALVLVTHNETLASRAGRVLHLYDGRIVG